MQLSVEQKKKIIEQLGFAGMPAGAAGKEAKQALESIRERLMKRVIVFAGEHGFLDSFREFLESNPSDEAFASWTGEHIPDLPKWLEEEVGKIRNQVSGIK